MEERRTGLGPFGWLLMIPLWIVYVVACALGLLITIPMIGVSVMGLVTGKSHMMIDDAPWLQHLLRTAPGLVLVVIAGVLVLYLMWLLFRGMRWLHRCLTA